MNSRTTTRAALLVATFFSLVLGGLAAIAPPASAEGAVTVTWPEITAFNPDTTDYVIDVEWDGAGDLYLLYASVASGESLGTVDEIRDPGLFTVKFPVHDPGGQRVLVLRHCPIGGFSTDCADISMSPVLDVTRTSETENEPSAVSVDWPAGAGINPDVAEYVPEITWDGRGSLFFHVNPEDGDYPRFYEVHNAGPYRVDFNIPGTDGTWTMAFVWCPGEVFENQHCSTVVPVKQISVWRTIDVQVGYTRLRSWGPDQPFPLRVTPDLGGPIDATWQVLDAGVVVAGGSSTLQVGDDLPSLGAPPQLVDGRTYALSVTVTSNTATYGRLTDTASFDFVWDSQNLSTAAVGRWVDGSFVETGAIHPAVDNYLDTLVFEVSSPTGDRGSTDIAIRDAAGTLVASYTDVSDRFPWSGTGNDGELLAAGPYQAEVTMTDSAGNVATEILPLDVSRTAIVRRVWRAVVGVDESLWRRFRQGCGRLKRPARAEWAGSVGYYTPDVCAANRYYHVGTKHELQLPASITGDYGRSRVTVVGGKARPEKRSTLWASYYRGFDRDHSMSWEIDGSTGRHVLPWSDGNVHTLRGREGTFLTWSVHARQGSRYDVRRFIVEVEYDVLE